MSPSIVTLAEAFLMTRPATLLTFDPSWTLASVLGDDVGLEAEL